MPYAKSALRLGVAFEQLGLVDASDLTFDAKFSGLRRTELGEGAWLDYQQGFVRGHGALYDELRRTTRFHLDKRTMYDNEVDVPRLCARFPDDGPGHPLLWRVQHALSQRYAEDFVRVSAALYRDGRDSVAWHGDTVARKLEQALVASISLGSPRKFLIRRASGGPSRALTLGFGDLLVMGGTCQRTFQHSIPKVASADGPRLVVMYRPIWSDEEFTDLR